MTIIIQNKCSNARGKVFTVFKKGVISCSPVFTGGDLGAEGLSRRPTPVSHETGVGDAGWMPARPMSLGYADGGSKPPRLGACFGAWYSA